VGSCIEGASQSVDSVARVPCKHPECTPGHCHLDRRRRSPPQAATEEEWRDPEGTSPTIPIRGVLPKVQEALLVFPTKSGENSRMRQTSRPGRISESRAGTGTVALISIELTFPRDPIPNPGADHAKRERRSGEGPALLLSGVSQGNRLLSLHRRVGLVG